MEGARKDLYRVDEWGGEKSGLAERVPEMIEVAVARVEDARRERKAEDDHPHFDLVDDEEKQPRETRKLPSPREVKQDGDREDQQGDGRVEGRGRHDHPAWEPGLGEEIALGEEGDQPHRRSLSEELPQEQAEDEVGSVVAIGGSEDEGEDSEQNQEHADGLE